MAVRGSTMEHGFDRVPSMQRARSTFDMSHGYKSTFDAGLLIPVLVKEVLPGDTWAGVMSGLARLQTLVAPIMDNVKMSVFWFFTPCRLLWTNWVKMNGEQVNPGDSTTYLVPRVDMGAGGAAIGSLWDYMGIPTGAMTGGLWVNALYSRNYHLVWNTWFRDENLQNSLTVDQGDGPDTAATYATVRRRGKRKDYITSCLPWPQKGTAVTLPLGTSADVLLKPGLTAPVAMWRNMPPYTPLGATGISSNATGDVVQDGGGNIAYDPVGRTTGVSSLFADLSTATAATIAQLRLAEMTQEVLELDARSGTRYAEMLKAVWGVDSGDARLQRPEYLGGTGNMLNVNPVPQTSATGATGTPQGNLAATGTFSVSSGLSKSFTEHGILMCLVCVDADLTYQRGLDRQFSRRTRFDYAHPLLANVGDQSVLNQELYAQGYGVAADAQTFGYQERYGEYRFAMSRITGLFRSTAAGTLDMWHVSENFGALPTLGDTFIQSNPPLDRVVAVPSQPHFYFDGWFNLKVTRELPTFGVPSLARRF